MKLAVKKTRKPAVRTVAKVKPALTLKADRLYVKTDEAIAVKVDMKGLDEVAFTLEPKRTFSIDLKSITRSGVVRLRGKRDGKATLIASGRLGSGEVIEKMVHVECEGHKLRLLAWGYWQRGAK